MLNARPWGVLIFIVVGVALWLIVTVAALAEVVRAPAENVGLAVFLALIWITLIVMAAMSRFSRRL
ncbi:MAG TPA: hypothetical protein VEY67_01500 [Candidatus Dormibacteraeota bacterium]|nr:hypothetical protein [Candidatus Dormibacteraeota bacterium]